MSPYHTPAPLPQKPSLPAPLSVGQMLQQGRVARGLSLAEVATVTRIPRNMLTHLERDRFEEYHASVFLRGHLTNYARELQLDVNAVLATYDRQEGIVRTPAAAKLTAAPHPPKPSVLPGRALLSQAFDSVRAQGRQGQASQQNAPTPSERATFAKSTPAKRRLDQLPGSIQPIHMVAALLVLFALVTCLFFLGHSQDATAQDPAAFDRSDTPTQAWGHEKDVNQARWFLEQSDATAKP